MIESLALREDGCEEKHRQPQQRELRDHARNVAGDHGAPIGSRESKRGVVERDAKQTADDKEAREFGAA